MNIKNVHAHFLLPFFIWIILSDSNNAQPKAECFTLMPDALVYERTLHFFTPNPFIVRSVIKNTGNSALINASAMIMYQDTEVHLMKPLFIIQSYIPTTILPGDSGIVQWQLSPVLKRGLSDTAKVCIVSTFDNHPPIACSAKTFIPSTEPIINCVKHIVPKININSTHDGYDPMPFTIYSEYVNDGSLASDSLFETIVVIPNLKLDSSEHGQAIKPLQPAILKPGEHATVSWTLWHPNLYDEYNYQYSISNCVHEKNYDSSCCDSHIEIPTLLVKKSNLHCTVSGQDTLVLVYDSLNDIYKPNPFQITVGIINSGTADADSVRATIILPPDVVLNPASQPLTKFFNPMQILKWKNGMPPNELSWNLYATKKPKSRKTYTIQIRIKGVYSHGQIDSTYCESYVAIPPVRPSLYCFWTGPDSLHLNDDKTRYTPNPFRVHWVGRNIGNMRYDYRSAQLFITNGTDLQVITPNPYNITTHLMPGDSITHDFLVQVSNSRTPRYPYFTTGAITEDGDYESCCHKNIYIPALSALMSCASSGPDTIHYDLKLKAYTPDPFIGKFEFVNTGGDTLRNVNASIMSMPPEIALSVIETTMVKTINELSPIATCKNEWQFQLTSLGKNLSTGKHINIGISYKADGIPLVENNCFFDVFIEPNPNPTEIKEQLSPSSFYLGQNYPNPFSDYTTIDLTLLLGEGWVEDSRGEVMSRRGEVVFKIYDIFGREVLDLSKEVIGNFASANLRSSLVISNSQLPSQGIYFYRLTIGNQSQTRMMTLLK